MPDVKDIEEVEFSEEIFETLQVRVKHERLKRFLRRRSVLLGACHYPSSACLAAKSLWILWRSPPRWKMPGRPAKGQTT